MSTAGRMTRAEILELEPTITLVQLARVLDVSEPTIRAAHRRGELGAMGLKVNKLGSQYRIVTSSVWAYLGLTPGASTAQSLGEDAGQPGPVSSRVRFLAPALRAVDDG